MPITEPVRQNNAIDEIAFVLQFKTFFPNDELVKNILDVRSELKGELPDFDITNAVMFQVNPSQAESIIPDKQIGIVCFKRSGKDPARHEWALRVEANRIFVTCSEYTNWNQVYSSAIKYLRAAASKIDLNANPVVEVVYQCVDKFICRDGDIVFGDLFSKDSEYLTRHIISNTPDAWHVHQGWFEGLSNIPARMLHNLNINMHHQHLVEKGMVTGKGQHEAIVSHLIRIQNTSEVEIKSLESLVGSEDGNGGYFKLVLENAHKTNKDVVRKLLSQEMLIRVGLESE